MAFHPFTIQCITCGTRLKVTDPGLLGTITFCLKCQSMVQVIPPDQDSPSEADAPAGKTAAAVSAVPDFESGFDDLDGTDQPPVQPSSAPGTPTPGPASTSRTAATETESSNRRQRAAALAAAAPAAAPPPAADTSSVAQPPPAPVLTMPVSPEPVWKKHLMLGLSIFSGIALATSAWLFWSAGQAREAGDPPQVAQGEIPDNGDEQPSARSEPISDEPSEAGSSAADAPPAQARESEQPAAAGGSVETAVAPEQPASESRPPLPELPEPGTEQPGSADPDQEPAEQAVPPGEETPPPADPPASDPDSVSDPLARSPFDFALDESLLPLVEPRPRPAEPELPAEPRPAPQPPEPSHELAALLEVPLPALRVRAMPLDRFAEFAAELLGRPVVLDPLGLERAGVNPQAVVALDARDRSVAELLEAALAPRGLSYRPLGDSILITAPEPLESERRRVRYRLDDLAESRQELTALAELIQAVIAPDSWASRGGPATIQVDGDSLLIEQAPAERHQILLLCEKLRVARGLPPRSRLEPARFDPAPRHRQAQSMLETPVSLNAGEPLPLKILLRQLGHQADADLQIDYLALVSSGYSAGMDAEVAVHQQPLSAALQQLLEPLDLVFHPLDSRRLVVTTPYALQRTMLWEVLPLPDNLTTVSQVEQWIERVQREIYPESWTAAGGPGEMLFDRGGRHLVVRQNPAVLAELADQLGL